MTKDIKMALKNKVEAELVAKPSSLRALETEAWVLSLESSLFGQTVNFKVLPSKTMVMSMFSRFWMTRLTILSTSSLVGTLSSKAKLNSKQRTHLLL